jgi:DNA mismatch repair protein MutS
MGLLDEYIETDRFYKDRYGPATALFLQCGDFFELYAISNADETVGADIYRVGDVCNLQVTRKNKAILENHRGNPLMAGFPLHALQKHAGALLAQDYTVVVMRQVTPPPNVTRKVTEILSPSMSVTPTTAESQYLMVLFLSGAGDPTSAPAGIAGVDITTGHTFVQEIAPGQGLAGDEILRAIQAWNPREIAVYSEGALPASARNATERLIAGACPGAASCRHLRWTAYNSDLARLRMQEAVLRRAYSAAGAGAVGAASGGLTERLNLERLDLARMAFTLLLEFAYEHNERIVQCLKPPQVLEREGALSLEYTSAVQLNLIGAGGATSGQGAGLVGLLNRCATAFGRRLFRERLLNPIRDAARLNARYDAIAEKIAQGPAAVAALGKTLSQMMDAERMSRRIQLGSFPPCDWCNLQATLDAAAALPSDAGSGAARAERIAAIRAEYADRLLIDECSKYLATDIRANIFTPGAYPELDALQAKLAECQAFLAAECERLPGSKLDCNERDGYYLSVTRRRWEAIAAPARAGYTARPATHAASSALRVSSGGIQKASDAILLLQRRIGVEGERYYREFLAEFAERAGATLDELVAELADLDVTVAAARNALDYGYVRPTLASAFGTGASGFAAKGLRHPIIERVQTDTDYVPNDIALGATRDGPTGRATGGAPNGWLLYGINASGKSSMMKAVGLNVVLAQAGMFVAASEFALAPYARLFTRIQMNDNIYRGLSSFTVEMTELRNILARADAQSLVLGDELCAGTESVSAIAIVAAGVGRLIAARASFVFATHLHELIGVSSVAASTSEGTVFVGHLHVAATADNQLVYDRTVKPGAGNPLYGLEVCKGLAMDPAFLLSADRIRREVLKIPSALSVGLRSSAYNASVVMDKCGVCGTADATETHHIRYQETADAETRQVAPGVHVHRASNLAPLCAECHRLEHAGALKIHGYRRTLAGVVLDFTRAPAAAAAPDESAPPPSESPGSGSGEPPPDLTWLRLTATGWLVRGKNKWLKRTEAFVVKLLKEAGVAWPSDRDAAEELIQDIRHRCLHLG